MQDIAERLAPTVPGRPEQPGEFEAWFRYVLQRGTTGNGVFGAKMMWNYFDEFKLRMGELPGLGDLSFNERLDAVFPRLKIIFVRRRDKVAQAVSLWKAIQTQQWRTESGSDSEELDDEETPHAEYDYRAIEHLLNELHGWDARWEDWFHATGREPIRVIYEEFANTRAATIGRVLDALGVDPPEPEGQADEAAGGRPLQGLGRSVPSRQRSPAECLSVSRPGFVGGCHCNNVLVRMQLGGEVPRGNGLLPPQPESTARRELATGGRGRQWSQRISPRGVGRG